MANNNDWVSVENSPSIRKRARAKERAKDPMRERNYGLIREDSGLPPLEKPGVLRTVKDTLRGLVGMSTKKEERRKKRQKENQKKLQVELQKEHDNKGGRRRTRRRRGGRRRRSRRRRRQRAGWICACGVGHEPGSACFLCGDAGPTALQTVQAAIAIQRAARAKQARRDGKRGGRRRRRRSRRRRRGGRPDPQAFPPQFPIHHAHSQAIRDIHRALGVPGQGPPTTCPCPDCKPPPSPADILGHDGGRRKRRKTRRRRRRRKTRRRRKQRGGFDPIPKFRYKPKVFLNASAPKEAPIPPKPWW